MANTLCVYEPGTDITVHVVLFISIFSKYAEFASEFLENHENMFSVEVLVVSIA